MNGTTNELDQLAKAIARSGGIGYDEAERISASPFLHTRLRARIEADQRKREEHGSGWFETMLVASRAIVALVLVTIFAASAFWITRSSTANNDAAGISSAGDINRIVVGGTCALSSTEQCAISTEEVLATMFADDGRKEDK